MHLAPSLALPDLTLLRNAALLTGHPAGQLEAKVRCAAIGGAQTKAVNSQLITSEGPGAAVEQEAAVRQLASSYCLLCSLEPSDPLMVALFEQLRPSRRTAAQRRKDFQVILDADERSFPADFADVVVRHFSRHNLAAQPRPTAQRIKKQLPELESFLTERDTQILLFVAQVGIATAEQIAELFWAGSVLMTQRRLRDLTTYHALFRVSGAKRDECYAYYLGPAAARVLGQSPARWSSVDDQSKISGRNRRHDIGVTELMLALRRSSGDCTISSRAARSSIDVGNMWATNHVGVSIQVPSWIDSDGKHHKAQTRNIRPDGFALIGIEFEQDQAGGIPQSFALPLLLENDTGTRPYHEESSDGKHRGVDEQIASYVPLAKSGAIKERFPELAVDGYDIPMLFVTQGRLKTSDTARVNGVRRAVLKAFKHHRFNLSELPPLLLAYQEDVHKLGLQAPVYDLSKPDQGEDQRQTLLAALIQGNRALIESRRLNAHSLLEIDPYGAIQSGPAKAKSEKQAADKARADQKLEQYQQQLAGNQTGDNALGTGEAS